MTERDEQYVRLLINERRELQRRLAGLTNAAIAEKIEVSRHLVDRISKGMSDGRIKAWAIDRA